jgi:energy-coupling factor transport system substrate-specific component
MSAVVAAVAANVALATAVHAVEIPLYFDSIGTIFVTLHLGLVPGLLVAVATNGLLALAGQVLFPFVCCSILTVLVVQLFRTHGWLGDYHGYLWMGLVIALSNGIGGSVLAYMRFEGVTEVHTIDRLVMGIVVTGRSLLTSVFWAGMLTNLMDKLMSVLVVYLLRGKGRLLEQLPVARETKKP